MKKKVVLMGDSAVGKTALSLRIAFDKQADNPMASIQAACVKFKTSSGEEIDLWDTAGQERFDAISAFYYKGSSCVLLTFDLGKTSTFLRAKSIYSQIRETFNGKVILVGNKSDL